MFAQLIDSLIFMHRHGIVHQDVKPGNILLEENFTVKLADFGIGMNHHLHMFNIIQVTTDADNSVFSFSQKKNSHHISLTSMGVGMAVCPTGPQSL